LGPLHKFGTGEARTFKFGIQINLGKSYLTIEKYHHRVMVMVQGHIFEFWDPLPEFGTGEARNVKFGIWQVSSRG